MDLFAVDAGGGVLTEKPWGWERLLASGGTLRLKVLSVKPGHRLSLQRHRFKSEVWWCGAAGGTVEIGGTVETLVQGRGYVVPPNTPHRLTGPCTILEATTGGGDWDIIRMEDDYGRQGA